MARPKAEEGTNHNSLIGARVTEDQSRRIRIVAAHGGMTVGRWAREHLLAALEKEEAATSPKLVQALAATLPPAS